MIVEEIIDYVVKVIVSSANGKACSVGIDQCLINHLVDITVKVIEHRDLFLRIPEILYDTEAKGVICPKIKRIGICLKPLKKISENLKIRHRFGAASDVRILRNIKAQIVNISEAEHFVKSMF